MAESSFPLMKDGLGKEAVTRLARALEQADPEFPVRRFRRLANQGLDSLELKERVAHIIAAMDACLPARYPAALKTVLKAGRAFPPGREGDPLAGFAAWPLIDWVPERGLRNFDASMKALARLTSLFSAEFAVRPFILEDPPRALVHIRGWTADPSEHVRRLASEGTRPRLPWGCRLPVFVEDPKPVLAMLEALKDDPSEYVRRSVANNLNDIAKDHPRVVVEVAGLWAKGASPERMGLVRHALRSLVKQGNSGAMRVLGFTTRPRIVATLNLNRTRLKMGQSLEFSVRLESRGQTVQNLVVDYAVHHMKKNGATQPKVFKLRTLELAPGQTVEISKNHGFIPRSVRKLYPGRHEIEILVAGKGMARDSFKLEK